MIAHFNQYFINKGIFDKEVYSIISAAYNIREKSDYDDFYIVSEEDALEQLENAKNFVGKIEDFLFQGSGQ